LGQNLGVFPLEQTRHVGVAKSEHPRLTIMMKLFSKNSNLHVCVTDRQTDRQTTCDRNTALCTKVHRSVKIEFPKFPEFHHYSTWDVRSLQTQTSEVYSKRNTRKFWPSDPPLVDLSVEDIRSQIAAELVTE